jgi:hypothetical protein
MRNSRPAWRAAPLLLAAGLSLFLGACGKSKPATTGAGGNVETGTGGSGSATGGSGAGGGGTSGEGGTGGGLAPCLDRPNDLPQPPGGGLPCELIPPSLAH